MKNERGFGRTRRITDLEVGVRGGELVIHRGWPGIVLADIIGTSEVDRTTDGRPIASQTGSGSGSTQVEGVFRLRDENGETPLEDGQLVDRASPHGVKKAAARSGKAVGHVLGDSVEEGEERYVEVKLLGRPAV